MKIWDDDDDNEDEEEAKAGEKGVRKVSLS